ncbi:MAG: hypothetical protein SFU85_04485 [Candidatus Methylacidiphilales bacterium]|nr:hypothetical protein [Candidatus Methylacidiphilales bacterium]
MALPFHYAFAFFEKEPNQTIQPTRCARRLMVDVSKHMNYLIKFYFLSALFACTAIALPLPEPDLKWLDPHIGQCLKDQESGTCTLHQSKMYKKPVEIRYGLFDIDPIWEVASMTKFPHARQWVGGGCAVDTAKTTIIFRCKLCEKARLKWLQDFPGFKDN